MVQHISTFARPDGGGAWAYSFTQEWPFHGMRNQLSYTVPVLQMPDGHRHRPRRHPAQLPLPARGRWGRRPPPGPPLEPDPAHGQLSAGRGAGGLGLQANLPLSIRPRPGSGAARQCRAHLTALPRSNPAGESAATLNAFLGGSAIWLLRPTLNLMFELLWLSTEDVVGPDRRAREGALFSIQGSAGPSILTAGCRSSPAWRTPSGLDDGAGADALFLYLSFEHPFRH